MTPPNDFTPLTTVQTGDLNLDVTMMGVPGVLTAKDVTLFLRTLPPVFDGPSYKMGILPTPTGPMAETWIRINSTYQVSTERPE